MYCNCSGSRPGEKNAQQNTEAVSGNWRKAGSVLFSEVFPAKLTDTGYYSGNRREYDFLLRKRNRGKVWI